MALHLSIGPFVLSLAVFLSALLPSKIFLIQIRTHRHRTGALCDLGAAYIHGTTGNPLVELAREAGISLKQVIARGNPSVCAHVHLKKNGEVYFATAAQMHSFGVLHAIGVPSHTSRPMQCWDEAK